MGDYRVIDEGVSATFIKNGKFLVANGDSCIQCEDCIPTCPGEALFMKDWTIEIGESHIQFGSSLAIKPNACILGTDCEGRCANACPTLALSVFGNNPDEDPNPDMPGFCELCPDICELEQEGLRFKNWLEGRCDALIPKMNDALQHEAMQWGTTVGGYIADKLDLIAKSGDYRGLGTAAKQAGWLGLAYGSYSAVIAVSDGKLTANELIGVAGTALGFVAAFTPIGLIGIGGLALISSGSLILGLIANTDVGKETVVANFDKISICN